MATDQMQARPASIPKYEAVFEQQLRRAVSRVRFLDVTAALLGLGAGTLLYALIVIAFDRWLVLSAVFRQAALILYLVTACAYVGFFVVRPLGRRVNPYYAAKRLEQTLPEAKNSVVNWLDLRHQELPGAIRSAVGQRAAHDAARADLDAAISGRRAAWAGSATGLLVVVLLVTLGVLGPSQFWSLLGRAFGPFGAGGIRTRTQIELHQPQGDAVVSVGRSVAFAATISGKVPAANRPDAPRLMFRYRLTDPFEERPLERERDSEWATNLPANQVHSGFWYKLAAGDAETPEYQVRVRATPLVEKIDVTYHYRPYLGWRDHTSDEPNIEAVRGTEVVLVAHTNRAVKHGECLIEGKGFQQPITGEPIPGDANALQFKFVLEQDGQYRIAFTSTDDETSPPQLPYQIKVLADRAPDVVLKKPGQDVTLPANGLLQLEGSASDDLGVGRMTLRMQVIDGPTLQPKPYRSGKSFKLDDGGYPKMLEYKDSVELDKVKDAQDKPFALQPKMVIEYWLEAADACDYPKPNVGESKHYKVTIGEPDKEEQKQQQERQNAAQDQQKHEQKQDQQLAKENAQRPQPNQDKPEPNQDSGEKNLDQQPGQDGGKDQPDPQTQQTQDRLNDALDQKDRRNDDKSSEKPNELDNKSERKDGDEGQDSSQPSQGKDKGDPRKKDGPGAGKDGAAEPGQDKDAGSKQGDNGSEQGEDKKGGQGGGKQEQSASKEGGGEGQPNVGEKKENGQRQGGKEEKASGKDGGKDGAKPDAAEPKAKGEPQLGQNKNEAEGKDAGQPGPMDKAQSKPDDQQPPRAEAKGGNKDDEQPKGDPGKGSQGAGEQGQDKPKIEPKDGAGVGNPGEKKDDKKGQGGDSSGSKPEKLEKPENGTGSGTGPKDDKNQTKPGTKPSAGQKRDKHGENARPEDVAKLAEQMKSEEGKKQEDAAKQLARAARNANDPKARDEARKALEQAERDAQTGEPNPATPKQGPEEKGQLKQGDKGQAETKTQPDKKGGQTGEAKTGDGGQDQGTKSERKDGGNSQGPGNGKGTEERPEGTPTGPAQGKGRGDKSDPGRGSSGGGVRSGEQHGDDEPPDLRGAPPDARDRLKKGELLLERFDKLLEKDKQKFLQDAKISDEDMRRLREDIARRKVNRPENSEQAPRKPGRGSRADMGAARVQGGGKSRAADTQYGGPGSPPPEFRDIIREFTGGQEKK